MREHQTKAMERMMAAHRQMAEQMASRQAEIAKRMQEQGINPMSIGFPGEVGPWGDTDMPEMPDMPAFGQMPEMPGFGQMPEMPAFGQMPDMPAMPEFPAMPEMPAPYGMDMPMAHVPPHVQARYAAMQAQRAKVMAESKARRDRALEEMTERRKEMEANRFTRPHRFARPFSSPHSLLAKAPAVQVPGPKAEPVVDAPAVEAAPAPSPAPAVETAPAAPSVQPTLAPSADAAPVAPAQAAFAPQG